MKTVVVLGAGKIWRMVVHLLAKCGDYHVRAGDMDPQSLARLTSYLPDVAARQIDLNSSTTLDEILRRADAVISCAPYHANPLIASRAKELGLHYLDLTEDVGVTRTIIELAQDAGTAFIPQCGLAPGFITIVAMHLIQAMTKVVDLHLRVGALPRYPSNMLKYNLTWSTEGLINEYCNPCDVLLNGKPVQVQPLENVELLNIDGIEYEAFNTSGGLGSLAQTLKGKVRNVNYKSLRYPGHQYLIRFLLDDLQMRDHQQELHAIFERALPTTFQDQVVIFVSATGTYRGRLTENTYARTILHKEIDGQNWSGIQITTAAGVCAVLDLLLQGKLPQRGFVRQEDVAWSDFIHNRFGKHYA